MGINDLLPPYNLEYTNNRRYYIKNKNMVVPKWLEESDTYLPIMLYPNIIHCLTPYIGNIKDYFVLAATKSWIYDRCK